MLYFLIVTTGLSINQIKISKKPPLNGGFQFDKIGIINYNIIMTKTYFISTLLGGIAI